MAPAYRQFVVSGASELLIHLIIVIKGRPLIAPPQPADGAVQRVSGGVSACVWELGSLSPTTGVLRIHLQFALKAALVSLTNTLFSFLS